MQIKAIHRNARISPQKVRPLARMLKGMTVADAEAQLRVLPARKIADLVHGVLKSAEANAVNNHRLSSDALKVADIQVDAGMKLKRFMPAAKGSAHPIMKRFCHITVLLDAEGAAPKKARKTKSKIETITVDEYATQQHDHDHDHDHDHEHEEKVQEEGAGKVKPTEPVEDAQKMDKTQQAFQKQKMNQLGGDKKKTHRRKSM